MQDFHVEWGIPNFPPKSVHKGELHRTGCRRYTGMPVAWCPTSWHWRHDTISHISFDRWNMWNPPWWRRCDQLGWTTSSAREAKTHFCQLLQDSLTELWNHMTGDLCDRTPGGVVRPNLRGRTVRLRSEEPQVQVVLGRFNWWTMKVGVVVRCSWLLPHPLPMKHVRSGFLKSSHQVRLWDTHKWRGQTFHFCVVDCDHQVVYQVIAAVQLACWMVQDASRKIGTWTRSSEGV